MELLRTESTFQFSISDVDIARQQKVRGDLVSCVLYHGYRPITLA